jgi:hypothetical protein
MTINTSQKFLERFAMILVIGFSLHAIVAFIWITWIEGVGHIVMAVNWTLMWYAAVQQRKMHEKILYMLKRPEEFEDWNN